MMSAKPAKSKILDDTDWRILTELQQNARIPVAEIGRRVCLSTPAVADRIAKMEEAGFIEGYRTLINYDKIGLTVKVFISFRSTRISHVEMIRLMDSIPEVQEWYTVTGNSCALIKVVAPSTKRLETILETFGQYGDTNTSIILSGNPDPKVLPVPDDKK